MLDVRYTTKFKKDLKLCQKRGLDISLFNEAVNVLRIPAPALTRIYLECEISGSSPLSAAVEFSAVSQ